MCLVHKLNQRASAGGHLASRGSRVASFHSFWWQDYLCIWLVKSKVNHWTHKNKKQKCVCSPICITRIKQEEWKSFTLMFTIISTQMNLGFKNVTPTTEVLTNLVENGNHKENHDVQILCRLKCTWSLILIEYISLHIYKLEIFFQGGRQPRPTEIPTPYPCENCCYCQRACSTWERQHPAIKQRFSLMTGLGL